MSSIQKIRHHIKNKNFRYILKRLLLIFLPQIPSAFYTEQRFRYNIFVFPFWTQFLKIPTDYSYILAGSHGVGFVAFIKSFEVIQANPMSLEHLFSSLDPKLLMRNHAKNYASKVYGLTFDKAYKDKLRNKIFLRLTHKVPLFYLVRDPISIIKTHTHPSILPILAEGIKNGITHKQLFEGGGGIKNIQSQLEKKIFSMLDFLTRSIIEDSKILPFFCFTSLLKSLQNSASKIYYIDTSDIQGKANIFKTMQKIASILNIPFDKKIDDFEINYSSVSLSQAFFPYVTEIIDNNKKIKIEFFTNTKNNNSKIISPSAFQCNGLSVYVRYFNEFDVKTLQNNHLAIAKKFDCISEQIRQLEIFITNGGIENLIIHILKKHSSIQKQLKRFLEYEVSSIQQNAPKIVENWTYYQKFVQNSS